MRLDLRFTICEAWPALRVSNFFLEIALSLLLLPSAALAGAISFLAPTTAPNSNNSADNVNESDYADADGLNQFNLDHHLTYTWRIANVSLPQGNTITGDTFRNLANWDTNSFRRLGRKRLR